MSFSLLLHSLEPKPTRKELEEISVNVRSIARADCKGLLDDWFGVVVSRLSRDDAAAFQAALSSKGYETDVVADADIPSLHACYRCQRISIEPDAIFLGDAMGKTFQRDVSELVFAAVGMIEKDRLESKYKLVLETKHTRNGSYTIPVNKLTKELKEKTYFRVDLFFSTAPHRISLEMDQDGVMFHHGRVIRLRNTADLAALMFEIQALLPPERENLSLRNLYIASPYPSMHAYEEELRWTFYRLGLRG